MRKICFIVNVDWFFHSHRRPLARKLSSTFNTSVIAGDSGIKTDYIINTFEVNSRVPTIRGIFQFYWEVKKLDRKTILVVVSPVIHHLGALSCLETCHGAPDRKYDF